MIKGSWNAQLLKFVLGIRSGLWFVPASLTFGAMCLALLLVELDRRYGDLVIRQFPGLLPTQAEGAQATLTAIASSMITVGGVVFSITIVALAMAASQYSSRVLRNFMRDRPTKIVLGWFVGVFVYCLLVLRVTSGGNTPFVPGMAVLGALLLALTACGLLIYFIHHISLSIQASTIIAAITRETCLVIDQVFPEEEEIPEEEHCYMAPPAGTVWHQVPSRSLGYVQTIALEQLVELAIEHQTIIRLDCRTGEFVGPGAPLISVALPQPINDEVIRAVNSMFAVANHRTIEQDPEFGFRQLVDIALKALSASINDTTTAVASLEHLAVLLSHCAARRLGAPDYYAKGTLCMMGKGFSFEDVVALAFSQILDHAGDNTVVLVSLMRAIAHVGHATDSCTRRVTLRRWLGMARQAAQRSAKTVHAESEVQRVADLAASSLAPGAMLWTK